MYFNKYKLLLFLILLSLFSNTLISQTTNLTSSKILSSYLTSEDIILEVSNIPSGYHLWVRKKANTSSVMLTESQRDPIFKTTSYALKVSKFYSYNGFEQRILNDKKLKTSYDLWMVIDSTVEDHPKLGDSFHLFLEKKMTFGYSWEKKNGHLIMENGVRINLRSFSKKLCDYSGHFIDQWLVFNTINPSSKNIDENDEIMIVNPLLFSQAKKIVDFAKGTLVQSDINNSKEDIKNLIRRRVIDDVISTDGADIIFVIDSTQSMKEEIPAFQEIFPLLIKELEENIPGELRIAIITYRDYGEKFLVKNSGFLLTKQELFRTVNSIEAVGGKDWEEAMFEAICSIENNEFTKKQRYVFIFADAPAHSTDKALVSIEDAFLVIEKMQLKVSFLCFP